MKYRTDIADLFWLRVAYGSEDSCWIWKGGFNKNTGYGRYYVTNNPRRRMDAHKIAFALTHGFIPPSYLCVCHTCDNRRCVNPKHLWLGTKIDNNIDRDLKGRTNNYTHWNGPCKGVEAS